MTTFPKFLKLILIFSLLYRSSWREENLARFSNIKKALFVSIMPLKSGKETLNLFYT